MVVDSDERSSVVEAFRARADGIFTREGPFEMLCKCIHAVHQGQIWANSKQLRFVIEIFGKREDRKSTRLNSSHGYISYAVFCLKKKNPSNSTCAIYCASSSTQT